MYNRKSMMTANSPELRQTVYPDAHHFLDLGAQPALLQELLLAQLADPEVSTLATKLSATLRSSDGTQARLKRIQQFIHDRTHHISQQERIHHFGYLSLDEIPYQKELILDIFSTVFMVVAAHGIASSQDTWQVDLNHNRCVGCKLTAFSGSMKLGEALIGMPMLQCSEEATLAAALAIKLEAVSLEQIVFFISPAHMYCFIRPDSRLPYGALFDSKKLLLPRKLQKYGKTGKERLYRLLLGLGRLWSIVTPTEIFDYNSNVHRESSPTELQIWKELEQFVSR